MSRVTRRLLLASTAIGVVAGSTRAALFSGLDPSSSGGGGPISLTNIALSNTSFLHGSTTSFGTFTVSQSSGTFAGTLGLGGTDAASFALTALGSGQWAIAPVSGSLAVGNYSVTVTATDATLSNSPQTSPSFGSFGGTLSCVNGGAIDLTRIINSTAGATTLPANAFWTVGHPFPSGPQAIAAGYQTVPSGSIFSATLTPNGGSPISVRCLGIAPITDSDGSLAWSQVLLDLSAAAGAALPATVQFTALSGSWSSTTTRSNSDWAGLVDTVTLTSLSTAGTSAADMDGAGTWTASFNAGASNMIEGYGQGPLGLYVQVTAPFINTGTIPSISISSITYNAGTGLATCTTSSAHGITTGVSFQAVISGATPTGYNGLRQGCVATGASTFTFPLVTNPGGSSSAGTFQQCHRFLTAQIEYWVTQDGSGNLGPIASRGPFITNNLAFKTSPALFTYDLTYKRNGSTVRSQAAVGHYFFAYAQLCRVDGEWDWSSSDPALWVTQDYTITRKTLKIAPFISGIAGNYAGTTYFNLGPTAVTGVNTSTGVLTVANINTFVNTGEQPYPVTAVYFTGTSMPTGITSNKAYWASFTSSTSTFTVYDTYAHAVAAGSTGKITPSTTGSSVFVRNAVAPLSIGQYEPYMGNSSNRADLSLFTEWGAAYHCGQTQNLNDFGRIQAFLYGSFPYAAINDATGAMPSLMDLGNTPASLGASLNTTSWVADVAVSSNINGGTVPPGGVGQIAPVQQAHTPASPYAVWLMEGGTILRDMILFGANNGVAWGGYLPLRNCTVSGTVYYGCTFFTQTGAILRAGAWSFRDVLFGWFVAPTKAGFGSAYRTYLGNIIASNCNQLTAYKSYAGSAFSTLGTPVNQEGWPLSGLTSPLSAATAVSGFMQSYMGIVAAFALQLAGNQIAGLAGVAAFCAQWFVDLFTPSSAWCPWFATSFYNNITLSDAGAAISYISDARDVGAAQGQSADCTIDFATSGVITWTFAGSPPGPAGIGPAGWALVAGDKCRAMNYLLNQGTSTPSAPSPFTDNTDYYIVAPVVNTSTTTGTFKLSATPGGSPITPSSNVTGVGCTFVPSGQLGGLCPAGGSAATSGFYVGTVTEPYILYMIAALALLVTNGVISQTAYNTATALLGTWTGFDAAGFAFQDTV